MIKYSGLSSSEAKKKLLKFGPNQIYQPEKISFFGIARHEVNEPMILLLLVVGIFYNIWGKLGDAITIFVIIFALVAVEVYNEFRAKKAIDSLSRIAAPKTRVRRQGRLVEINSEEVVPGDLLVLITGTSVAADARIIDTSDMELDESSLTGESFGQNKINGDEIYAGTVVTGGEGLAEVFATGKNTKMGKVAGLVKKVKAPKTPLQLAMKSLAGKLVYVAVLFSLLIPILGVWRGQDLKTMILTGLSLAFATIPEELPIMITMVLGLGAYTLSRHNFLVKKIKAAETLGNATVIVTDKTGTITESKMKIVSLFPNDRAGDIMQKAFYSLTPYSFDFLDREINARAQESKIAAPDEIIKQRNFSDGRKTKSLLRKAEGGYELFMSGAPEQVFVHCHDISPEIKSELLQEASRGRRVIAVASRKISDIGADWSVWEKDLDFCGIISFEDPPRAGVKETIARAAGAGIRTIMVTGDHPLTAAYIASEVGIAAADEKAVTGDEIDKLSDKELRLLVKNSAVFARATPQNKYRIVEALQANGEVVAVTGDGINDTLALKAADIGIAMGIRGTDVAKEAAEVVIADDNYVTIARGIFEGRKFFDNLRKGIKYYLSVKIALIMIFLLPALLGISMPLAPIQIIILELFMDLAASSGFVSEPAEKDIYTRPPRNHRLGIFNAAETGDLFLKGVFLFLAVSGVYFFTLWRGFSALEAQTMAFAAWMIGHIALAFVSRAEKESLFSLGFFTNKVINIWALTASAFLLVAIYTPLFDRFLDLQSIKFSLLISVVLFVILFIGLLELKEYMGKWKIKKL
jgi:P-type Ca2+ transporter type 2C